jgi:[ribosomal protein S5]-alanine N-acetyltransferase
MQPTLQTQRLSLNPIAQSDAVFMLELLNTSAWITFIGQRNVLTIEAAGSYIEKLILNPTINYWVVKLPATQTAVGVITLLKKDYLASHDIGFAFLPQYAHNGFAYEAAKIVLDFAQCELKISPILATTIPQNHRSIHLLEKLGLSFEKEMVVGDEILLLYSTK